MASWNKKDGMWQSSLCGPPHKAGVYCITLIDDHRERTVVYIGSSKDILRRAHQPKHPYRQLYSKGQDGIRVSLSWKLCSNYQDLERRLIRRIRPKYNVHHTGLKING